MRRYRVVEERGSWYMVSDNYEPARKGNLGRGTYFDSFSTQQLAQDNTDARNRAEELKDAKEILHA